MLLGNLLKSINRKYQKIPIEGISFDSRKTKKNDVFFAIDGDRTSGDKFINQAIKKGASAIISKKKKKYQKPSIRVKDVRKSLAEASSNFYKKKPDNIIAVTGTNGKSSVANFFFQILSFFKINVASIGTLGIISKKFNKKTKLTSMDSLSLHKYLNILAKKKIKNVILEASSHGLHQKRLDNLNIKIGIFTNFSHDHLDYHKSIKSYFNAKMYLFNNLLKRNSLIITDEENKEYGYINKIAEKKKIKKYTLGKDSGEIKILNNRYNQEKQIVDISFKSKKYTLEIPLIGYFQVKNLFMAMLAASKCGLNIEKIFKHLHKIKPVPGRNEKIFTLKNNSHIIIDFAHTPDALEQCLISLKKQFKREIIVVFGCGGERDKTKRSMMGKIAYKYCRKIFVTDDNPRNENPKKIRSEIIKYCKKKAINIGNRKKAIDTAIKELNPNEILLIAGKGHEQTQDRGGKIIKFSDKAEIKKLTNRKNLFSQKYSWSNFLAQKTFNKKYNNIKFGGVSINTKDIKKNDLFFALKGKKMDGHKFANLAIKKGAIKSVVSKKIKKLSNKKSIKVRNTFHSLNTLARVTRNNSQAKIIGITGSVGKTTLKNLLAFALQNYGKIYFSPRSYNNKYGVPVSLSNLKSNTKFGVFEIGMDKKGEIDNLSKLVRPDIGIITNVAEAHFKNFATLKDIAKAKGEIIKNILDEGSLILNKDDRFYKFFLNQAKRKKLNVISFSVNKKADISLINIKKINKNYRIKISINNDIFYFNTSISTKNFIFNLLACISILHVLDLNLNVMKEKFKKFKIPTGRGDIKIISKFNKKFKFIDESYNANPLSMKSAIDNMNHYKTKGRGRKLIFLGDMLELGQKSKNLHKKLSGIINNSDIDKVFVYGNYIKETFNRLFLKKKGKVFNNLEEAYNHFAKIIHNNDLLMVKGSNATGLNQFSKNIKKGSISAI